MNTQTLQDLSLQTDPRVLNPNPVVGLWLRATADPHVNDLHIVNSPTSSFSEARGEQPRKPRQ